MKSSNENSGQINISSFINIKVSDIDSINGTKASIFLELKVGSLSLGIKSL